MGRKKFKSYNKEKKNEIVNKINTKINEIVKLKKSYQENLDIFEAVNDETKDLFECDLTCDTCGEEDRGKCMQNFRMGNIFLQRQCLILITTINSYLEVFEKILTDLGYEILADMGINPEKERKESDMDYFR